MMVEADREGILEEDNDVARDEKQEEEQEAVYGKDAGSLTSLPPL